MESLPHLRDGEHGAHGPRHRQHAPVPPRGRADGQRAEDGRLSVQADHHRHESAGVHGLQLEEHEEPAGRVARQPLYRDVPRGVHRHHDEGDQQIRRRQVDDQHPDVRLALVADGRPEHGGVAEGGHAAQDEGDDHPDLRRRGEGGQLQGPVPRRPVTARGRPVAAGVEVPSGTLLIRDGRRMAAGGLVHLLILTEESTCSSPASEKSAAGGSWCKQTGAF